MPKINNVDNDAMTISVDMDEARNHINRTFSSETSNSWEPRPEHNGVFLKAQMQYANDVLFVKGYLFLNDVYEALGFPRTAIGAIVGWRKENFVDFGVTSVSDPIRLEFNVSGPILDLL